MSEQAAIQCKKCKGTDFSLLYYTVLAMVVVCTKCKHKHTILGPPFPLRIGGLPQKTITIENADILSKFEALKSELTEKGLLDS